MSKVIAACLMLAAQTYSVPPAVLMGIYNVEGGKPGQQVINKNGSYDLGPMQINTVWMGDLADYWGVSEDTAKKWVRDDVCTNVGVSAWILRKHLNETGSLGQAIAHYHSKTPTLGSTYRRKVVSAMEKQGLLLPPGAPVPATPSVTVQATQSDTFGKSATFVKTPRGTIVPETHGTVGLSKSAGLSPGNTRYAAHGMNSITVHNPVNRNVD